MISMMPTTSIKVKAYTTTISKDKTQTGSTMTEQQLVFRLRKG
jgi:hypothetical protein